VPTPGQVELDLWHFTSNVGFTAYGGYDDGRGDCGFLGRTGLDLGWRSLEIRYWDYYGYEHDYTTYYYVG